MILSIAYMHASRMILHRSDYFGIFIRTYIYIYATREYIQRYVKYKNVSYIRTVCKNNDIVEQLFFFYLEQRDRSA